MAGLQEIVRAAVEEVDAKYEGKTTEMLDNFRKQFEEMTEKHAQREKELTAEIAELKKKKPSEKKSEKDDDDDDKSEKGEKVEKEERKPKPIVERNMFKELVSAYTGTKGETRHHT